MTHSTNGGLDLFPHIDMDDKPENQSVLLAAEYLAHVAHDDYGTSDGPTALFYELLAVVAKHCAKFNVTTGIQDDR